MTWKEEHGEDYDVPDEITGAEGIEDLSWHNDACPSFGKQITDPPSGDQHDLRIWVEHPDPDQRESGFDHRYAVNYQMWSAIPVPDIPHNGDDDLYAGDDPLEALAALGAAAQLIHVEMARRARRMEEGAGLMPPVRGSLYLNRKESDYENDLRCVLARPGRGVVHVQRRPAVGLPHLPHDPRGVPAGQLAGARPDEPLTSCQIGNWKVGSFETRK